MTIYGEKITLLSSWYGNLFHRKPEFQHSADSLGLAGGLCHNVADCVLVGGGEKGTQSTYRIIWMERNCA